MTRGRLEAFSDGVIAIILTIMVLELQPPHGHALVDLLPLLPKFSSYVLSFTYLAIYWNNHHHLLHAVERVNGKVLWANMTLLFCLSLIPFTTAWMGEHGAAPVPVAIYGAVLLSAAVAYYLLTRVLLGIHAPHSPLARALGADWKGRLSAVAYAVALPLAFVHQAIAIAIYISVAIVWLVPDARFERVLEREGR
jgi:TMEM175 potassium channel family protein